MNPKQPNFRPVVVKNWTDGQEIRVIADVHTDRPIGKLVNIIQQAGSVHFQFSLRPEQAVKLAQVLLDAANALDDMGDPYAEDTAAEVQQ